MRLNMKGDGISGWSHWWSFGGLGDFGNQPIKANPPKQGSRPTPWSPQRPASTEILSLLSKSARTHPLFRHGHDHFEQTAADPRTASLNHSQTDFFPSGFSCQIKPPSFVEKKHVFGQVRVRSSWLAERTEGGKLFQKYFKGSMVGHVLNAKRTSCIEKGASHSTLLRRQQMK